MPIDTIALHIDWQLRRDRNSLFNMDSICATSLENGYELIQTGRSNSGELKFQLDEYRVCVEATRPYARTAPKAVNIRWQPSQFDTLQQSLDIMHVLDRPINLENAFNLRENNGLMQHASFSRMDYFFDLPYDISTVMGGFYLSENTVLTAIQDILDPESARVEYEFRRGDFGSYRIGKGNKYLRIYDLNRRNRIAPDEVRTPRTRIELSINGKGHIRSLMNSGGGQSTFHMYQGLFSELPDHLTDIAEGRVNPFEGMLLNSVIFSDPSEKFAQGNLQSPRFWSDVKNYHSIQRDIEQGLFLNVCRRLNRNRNFMRTHHRHVEIHPWAQRFQLTQLYRKSVRKFLGQNTRPIVFPQPERLFNRVPQPLGRWPIELTH